MPNRLAFERLIFPISLDEFFSSYWEKKPLHIARGDRGYYGAVAGTGDVDALIAGFARGPGLGLSVVDKVEGRVRVREFDAGYDPNAIYRAVGGGATLRVRDARKHFAGAQVLASEVTRHTGAPALINLYLTPPGSNGFPVHQDEHEVFVVQTAGRKHWHVYRDPVSLPNDRLVRGRPGLYDADYRARGDSRLIADADVPEPLLDVVLEPGDFLYVPRGWYHKAYTSDALSVHFTIGAYTVTWHDAVLAALAEVFDEAQALRRSLPHDFASGRPDAAAVAAQARAAVAAVAEHLTPEAVAAAVERLGERVVATAPALHHGLLDDLDGAPELPADAPVRLRDGVVPRTRAVGDKLVLAFNGQTVGLPRVAEPVVDLLLRGGPVTADALPTGLPAAGKLALVRQLVRVGFLTPAASGDGLPAEPALAAPAA